MGLKTRVKEYREKAGLKQSDLAELVHARRETIVHLENGRYNPSLKLAMDIAKVFQVTVEELFEFTEETETQGAAAGGGQGKEPEQAAEQSLSSEPGTVFS